MDWIKTALCKTLNLYLKDGTDVCFKVNSYGLDWIGGYDDEGLYMKIEFSDIESAREVQKR